MGNVRKGRLVARHELHIAALLAALLLGGGGGAVAHAGNPNPGIAPIQSHPHGKSYAEWAAAWWRWAYRAPTPVSPLLDQTGANCAVGQSGSVWFLAGSFSNGATMRDCTVSAGKALFFPLVNWVWVQFITDPPFTIDEIRANNKPVVDSAVVAAEIDGHPVKLPGSYREQSTVFTADFPLDNVAGLGAGQCAQGHDGLLHCYPSLDDGIYLFLEPLKPGEHTIHFTGSLPLVGFSLDVTYNLHVAAPGCGK